MGCGQSVNVAMQSGIPANAPKLRGKRSSIYTYLELEQSPTGMYVRSPRSKMKLQVAKNQDFLSHHLENQLCLSSYATAGKIRARQIIEHYMFNDLSHRKVGGEHSTSKLTEFALKAWFQRTFLDCIERAQNLYFNKGVSYDAMRERLAEQYIFQIYKIGQFINSGFGKFGDGKHRVQIPLSLILLNSDSSLYPLLKRLQEKYPLVQDNQNIVFPIVQPMVQNINLLKLINSKCYSDPEHLNIQTIFDDLKLLIDEANSSFSNFQSDMKELLGVDVLTDCKVKSKLADEKISYSASSTRRVFIKWSQTLIERIPDIYLLEEFLEFIKSKKKMANQFIFKSILSETTHHQVIRCLSLLLESIKYQIASKQPREEFGLFLYDLLRCKTTRKTGEEVVELLESLKATTKTPSGKYFEVVRIKNRFKYATRDILVNFRYGEHLVAEAQLCIDSPHDSPDVAKRIKFRHYLYELQRGLFGPTFELIMQYEDSSRKDISVHLQAEGLTMKRNLKMKESLIKKAGRLCPQKHEMIAIKGNIFKCEKLSELVEGTEQIFNCDFCFDECSLSKEYHYCYYCSLFYCLKCLNIYKSTDYTKMELSCSKQELLTPLNSLEEISKICKVNKAVILIIYREGRPACRMFLDQVIYLLSTYASQGKQIPAVYTVNIAHLGFKQIVKKNQITRLPTTLLLNEEEEAQVTLVGSTFHDIEGFFEIEHRIKSKLPKGIKIKCSICNETMSSQYTNIIEDLVNDKKCQTCMDTNKIEDLGDLIRAVKYSHKDFQCINGHVKCGYCSYLSSNDASYFRDHTGRSYLSNKLPIKPTFCENYHLISIIPQPPSFTCSKCKQTIEDVTDEEIGYCFDCNIFICSECFETDTESFKEREIKEAMKSVEIVSHLAEDYAEEAWPCGCGKLFLKVYQTRKKDNYNNKTLFKSLLLEHQQKKWTCYVCRQETSKLKLRLACFYCSYAEEIEKKISHVEICMNCCMRSGLIGRRHTPKVVKQVSDLQCNQGHGVIKTSIRRENETYFECVACKKQYYANTQRYECEICPFNCCIDCSCNILIDPKPITTSKKCTKSHQLRYQKRKPGIQFCTACFTYLQGSHFTCSSSCRYFLCLDCAV